MTVAEQIKRRTKALTHQRDYVSWRNAVKSTKLFGLKNVAAYEYQFIDGSKLTCRIYG
jgi:hypothetical protein